MRWVRLRELEAWAGGDWGARESENLNVFEHHRHKTLEGQLGAGGGAAGRAGIELLVNWAGLAALDGRPVSSTRVALAQFLVGRRDRPRRSNATLTFFFLSFSGCDDVKVPSCT